MKGGGSRLNVNIHKPRSALIRIENKVLPSSRAAQSPASDPRPRPQLPPAAIHPHIRHAPSERARERPALPRAARASATNFVSAAAARHGGTARHGTARRIALRRRCGAVRKEGAAHAAARRGAALVRAGIAEHAGGPAGGWV